MRLKDKVKETPKAPQDVKLVVMNRERGGGKKKKRLVMTREEMASLLHARISTLQGAKIGAEGLTGVLCFLEEELPCGELENSEEYLVGGLYEITLLLHKCLKRETDALERAVWAFSETQDSSLFPQACQKVEAILAARRAPRQAPATGDPHPAA